MFLAAVPAALSAQTAGGTLELVQELSVSGALAPGLSTARENAAKPFSSQHQVPPAVSHNGPKPPSHQNPGNHNNPGHNNPGNHNGHNNPGNHNGHNNPPVVVHPPSHPVYPPYQPGYNHNPYNPYYPGHPGYIPSGPSHETTSPVVSHPGDFKKALILGAVVLAVVVLLAVLL